MKVKGWLPKCYKSMSIAIVYYEKFITIIIGRPRRESFIWTGYGVIQSKIFCQKVASTSRSEQGCVTNDKTET